jgi:predicted HAD superfamily Cof-like phosphohydrolase
MGLRFEEVVRFQREVLSVPAMKPRSLTGDVLARTIGHLVEELTEFSAASHGDLSENARIADQADALVDLAYVAFGALVQMGVAPGAAFEEVHSRNMKRKFVEVDRFGRSAPDAVKPEGWAPPDWALLLSFGLKDIKRLHQFQPDITETIANEALGIRMTGPDRGMLEDREETCKPKLLILGHGRHGKDTVAELISLHGYEFTSSSRFCADEIIFPALAPIYGYKTADECYQDRGAHRAEWFQLIADYNTPDASMLGRAIFADNDIYVGLRSKREFHALRNAGLFDVVIWVDASDRLPPEDASSISVEPWMADFVIENNGSLNDLELEVFSLLNNLETTYNWLRSLGNV